jgi:hypothetical protein
VCGGGCKSPETASNIIQMVRLCRRPHKYDAQKDIRRVYQSFEESLPAIRRESTSHSKRVYQPFEESLPAIRRESASHSKRVYRHSKRGLSQVVRILLLTTPPKPAGLARQAALNIVGSAAGSQLLFVV